MTSRLFNLALDDDSEERFIAEPRPPMERRASPREQVFLTGLMVRMDGTTAPCIIVDRSRGGFRIQLESGETPDSFGLIDLVAGTAYRGETAWRNEPFAGARKTATYDLQEPQSGFAAVMQSAWRQALA